MLSFLLAWTGRAQSSQGKGAVAGKALPGRTFLRLHCGLWCPLVTSMPRTRGPQQPLPQTQLPAWLTSAAGVAEGRAKGAGGLVGAPAQGWINQHHQDNVAVMACHGAWVVLSPMEMRSTPRAARVMHRNSRDLMGSAQTGPCKGPLSLPVNGASWMTIHKS